MTQSLAKYHSRNPRYILQPQDNTLIRVAGPRQVPWEEGTEIRNISLSGLAFTAPVELCPIVGEFIKIQFQVSETKPQMACFGLVTRLEPVGSSEILVGVQFYKLEMPHRMILLQGLAHRLKEQQKSHPLEDPNQFQWGLLKQHWQHLLFMFILLSLWVGLVQWAWRLV